MYIADEAVPDALETYWLRTHPEGRPVTEERVLLSPIPTIIKLFDVPTVRVYSRKWAAPTLFNSTTPWEYITFAPMPAIVRFMLAPEEVLAVPVELVKLYPTSPKEYPELPLLPKLVLMFESLTQLTVPWEGWSLFVP